MNTESFWIGMYMGLSLGGLLGGAVMAWIMQIRHDRTNAAQRSSAPPKRPVLGTVYWGDGSGGSRMKIDPAVIDDALKVAGRKRPTVPFVDRTTH